MNNGTVKFTLRMSGELHRMISYGAFASNQSMNLYCCKIIEAIAKNDADKINIKNQEDHDYELFFNAQRRRAS